jgi:pantoate--beta-alanine ligase
MQTIESINEMQSLAINLRSEKKLIGFVPTLGGLHEGHLSLVDYAKKKADLVVASIYLNPEQFGPNEDFDRYPKTLEKDLSLFEERKVDIVFIPDTESIYPADYSTYLLEENLSAGLCGLSRPVYFRGVATVVAILFNIVRPDFAVFGQKDAQQCAVIKKFVRDLQFPIEIDVCPTVREADGLAMSSRNAYMDDAQRKEAAALYQSLQLVEKMVDGGEENVNRIIEEITTYLSAFPLLRLIYASVVHRDSLEPLEDIAQGQSLIAIAAWCDDIRLIDNIVV